MTFTTLDSSQKSGKNWALLSKVISVCVACIGIIVLIGWAFDISLLKSIHPKWVSMKANTALAFALSGLSLWFLHFEPARSWIKWCQILFAFFVGLIGLLTLCEYIFKIDFKIDQLLFQEVVLVETSFPGRMSPVTAINFLLAGISLLLLAGSKYKNLWTLAQALAFIVGAIAFWSVLGYFFDAQLYYYFPSFTSIALHSALAFLLLAAGIFFVKPDFGLALIITNHSVGGLIARRLLPATIVVPTLFAWLRLLGQNAGFYDQEFSLALLTISTIMFFAILIVFNAYWIYRMDLKRQGMEQKLSRNAELISKSNAELEQFNRLAVGRELKMIELKREINALYEKAGNKPPYNISFSEKEMEEEN